MTAAPLFNLADETRNLLLIGGRPAQHAIEDFLDLIFCHGSNIHHPAISALSPPETISRRRRQLAIAPQFAVSCSAPRSESALSVKVGLAELSVGKTPQPAT